MLNMIMVIAFDPKEYMIINIFEIMQLLVDGGMFVGE